MELYKTFFFEASHWLPHVHQGHKCRRMHGHSYRVVVRLDGPLDPVMGWVVDFAEVSEAWKPLHSQLDHNTLNTIEGLENPTSEVLARWIGKRLAIRLPQLTSVEVRETRTSAVVWRRVEGGGS